jgi:5-(carboxyamino)imidazole ribonucleotide synthase
MTVFPGSTIGILGGGQLGRMLAQAATKMGYKTHIYCPDKDSPAFETSTTHTLADYGDVAALTKFAASVDIITYEFENIPTAPLTAIADKLFPSLDVLKTCQHRVLEKQTVNHFGIKTAPFVPVSNQQEFKEGIKKIGLPAVLKTCRMGYDGKGQWKVKERHPREGGDLEPQSKLPEIPAQGGDDIPFILEGFVDFRMEISVIVARGKSGEMQCYCPVENRHKNHILAETLAPASISPALAAEAEAMAKTIAEGLGLVGILAVEMFVTKDDQLLVNELAPRPHNSGHWTIDAAHTSQFEQTIRAICGLPLGDPTRTSDARMINLIGDDILDAEKHARAGGIVHLYGKKESRPGRKMGHVTELLK